MSAKGSVFIATSVDGYIARADGGLDWLEVPTGAGAGEDYGYADFMKDIGALLLGRATYEVALRFDPWPYGDRRVVVLSRSLEPRRDAAPGHVEVTAETPERLFERLGREGVERVYVDGGQTITACLRAGLIDHLTITRIPVLLGGGIPLFGALPADVRLRHLRTETFDSGLVQTTYAVAGVDQEEAT